VGRFTGADNHETDELTGKTGRAWLLRSLGIYNK